ncbi:hypothetical protein GVAV_001439 [Gurleya vavrai]
MLVAIFLIYSVNCYLIKNPVFYAHVPKDIESIESIFNKKIKNSEFKKIRSFSGDQSLNKKVAHILIFKNFSDINILNDKLVCIICFLCDILYNDCGKENLIYLPYCVIIETFLTYASIKFKKLFKDTKCSKSEIETYQRLYYLIQNDKIRKKLKCALLTGNYKSFLLKYEKNSKIYKKNNILHKKLVKNYIAQKRLDKIICRTYLQKFKNYLDYDIEKIQRNVRLTTKKFNKAMINFKIDQKLEKIFEFICLFYHKKFKKSCKNIENLILDVFFIFYTFKRHKFKLNILTIIQIIRIAELNYMIYFKFSKFCMEKADILFGLFNFITIEIYDEHIQNFLFAKSYEGYHLFRNSCILDKFYKISEKKLYKTELFYDIYFPFYIMLALKNSIEGNKICDVSIKKFIFIIKRLKCEYEKIIIDTISNENLRLRACKFANIENFIFENRDFEIVNNWYFRLYIDKTHYPEILSSKNHELKFKYKNKTNEKSCTII